MMRFVKKYILIWKLKKDNTSCSNIINIFKIKCFIFLIKLHLSFITAEVATIYR